MASEVLFALFVELLEGDFGFALFSAFEDAFGAAELVEGFVEEEFVEEEAVEASDASGEDEEDGEHHVDEGDDGGVVRGDGEAAGEDGALALAYVWDFC